MNHFFGCKQNTLRMIGNRANNILYSGYMPTKHASRALQMKFCCTSIVHTGYGLSQLRTTQWGKTPINRYYYTIADELFTQQASSNLETRLS